MPFVTKDVGGGLTSLQYEGEKPQSAGSQLDQAKDMLGLVDLGQRIELGGLDRQLKQNQIDMLPLAKLKAEAETDAAQIGAKKAQIEYKTNVYNSILNAARINPLMAKALAEEAGIGYQPNADGTADLMVPGSNGKTHVIKAFNALKETDPSKIVANANALRDEYTEGTKGFVVVDSAWKTAQKAAQFKTGAGDAGLVASAARSLNPTEALNKGDIELVNTSNLGNYFKNLYNRNKDGDAPFLTDQERTNLLELTQLRYNVTRDQTVAFGRKYGELASNPTLGIRKEDVLVDRGSLSIKDLFPEEYPEKKVGPEPAAGSSGDAEMHLTDQPGGEKKQPSIEAGVPRGAKTEPPVRKRKEPRYEISEDGFNKMLGDGAKEFMKGNR